MERKEYWNEKSPCDADSMSWIYSAGRLEQAIHSEEFIMDKKDLLGEFLWIPFQQKKGELSYNIFIQETSESQQELEKMYLFYFFNISSAFQNLSGEERQIERKELYLCIGGFLKELYGSFCLKERAKEEKTVYHMVLSGIMNGMVYSGVEDNVMFCDYVFSEVLSKDNLKELSTLQLHLYVLFQEVMDMFGVKSSRRKLRIKKMDEWKPVKEKEDISIYAYFWNIWVRMFHIPLVSKMKHFKAAMQTMTGHGNESQAVLEMRLPMGREG